MARLEHPLKAEIEAVRAIVLRADHQIQESIKWNAPSFFISEHFATFKLHPTATVQVVLHTGAKRKPIVTAMNMNIDDPAGFLSWPAVDRCVATFDDLQDVTSKETAFVAILRAWIAQL